MPRLDFLGLQLDVPKQQFFLTTKQRTKLQTKTTALLAEANKRQRKVNRHHLAQCIGYFQFCANALHSGRIYLLDLYAVLHQTESWSQAATVKLTAPATRILRHFWMTPPPSDEGRPWGPNEKIRVLQLALSTDASGVAWGAHAHGKWSSKDLSGTLALDTPTPPTSVTTIPAKQNMRG